MEQNGRRLHCGIRKVTRLEALGDGGAGKGTVA